MLTAKLAFLLQLLTVYSEGAYLVQLRVTSYTNPSNKCAECNIGNILQPPYGCCDDFTELETCEDEEKCDNYFRYCLREYGTSAEIMNCTMGDIITSNRPTFSNFDSDTDFSGPRVLGLDNPLSLSGVGEQWQGIQVYIEAHDYDLQSSNELIDTFAIDIPQSTVPELPESSEMLVWGRFNFARITLQYRILCEEFYFGSFCEHFNACLFRQVVCQNNGQCVNQDNDFFCQCPAGYTGRLCEEVDYCSNVSCNNRGRCIQGPSTTFTCDCDPGFTGQLCETELNECTGVDCSQRGQCVDGVNSFSCDCDPGFTGQLCETDIDDCLGVTCNGQGQCVDGLNTFTCVCDPDFTGELCALSLQTTASLNPSNGEVSIPALAGGIVGGIVGLILIIFACVLVVCAVQRNKGSKTKETTSPDDYWAYGKDNPVYGAPMSNGFSILTEVDSNRMSLPPQTDLAVSDERLYAEPTQLRGDRQVTEEEYLFQNPLYHSTEDLINEAEEDRVEMLSFVGTNGSYLSPLQQNECLI